MPAMVSVLLPWRNGNATHTGCSCREQGMKCLPEPSLNTRYCKDDADATGGHIAQAQLEGGVNEVHTLELNCVLAQGHVKRCTGANKARESRGWIPCSWPAALLWNLNDWLWKRLSTASFGL